VRRALHELFERWDGRGAPQRLAGEAIAPAAGLAQLAGQALVFHGRAPSRAHRSQARRQLARRGRHEAAQHDRLH
jgi:response regulator RpfG family c-di-GMP phosphodiesterase